MVGEPFALPPNVRFTMEYLSFLLSGNETLVGVNELNELVEGVSLEGGWKDKVEWGRGGEWRG